MLNKEFGFMEKRLVFKEGPSSSPSETPDTQARSQLSILRSNIDMERAEEYPFEFLKENRTVNGEASPAQILALRKIFMELVHGADGRGGSLIIDILQNEPESDDTSTSRLDSTTQGQNIGWLDTCILQFRIENGQTLDENSLVIDSQLISDIVQFVEQDPVAFKPATVVEAVRAAERAEQDKFDEAERQRYAQMTPEQREEALAREEIESEGISLEIEQEEEARRAAFVAWRVSNPLLKRSQSQSETLDSAARLQIETELAQQHPFEFLKANQEVNGEASPAQILALRLIFEALSSISESAMRIDILQREPRFEEASTNRLETNTRAQDIGWLDAWILQVRIENGQTLNENSLVIDSELISDIVKLVEADPIAFKPDSVAGAAEAAQRAEFEAARAAEAAKTARYAQMTPEERAEAIDREIRENARISLEIEQEEQARIASFTAWRAINPIPKR